MDTFEAAAGRGQRLTVLAAKLERLTRDLWGADVGLHSRRLAVATGDRDASPETIEARRQLVPAQERRIAELERQILAAVKEINGAVQRLIPDATVNA